MPQELVSIISPCYNVGPYIGRFLDSLIAQTYKKLEIILVNDGATDNTGEMIQSYIPRLEAEGYRVLYIEQENGGQSSAVNAALKLVTGSFLTWPDPDDWLTPDSIEKRLRFLQDHPEVGMVRCNIEMIDEQTGKSLGFFERLDLPCLINDAFNKLVFVHTWFGAVACMVRMKFFDSVVSGRDIYVNKRGGQNWQMMLPMALNYPFWQMPEVLGYYCVRNDSHSHSATSFEQMVAYSNTCENVLLSTLSRLNVPRSLIAQVQSKYAQQKFAYALLYAPGKERFKLYKEAVLCVSQPKEKILLTIKLMLPKLAYRAIRKLINIIKHEK